MTHDEISKLIPQVVVEAVASVIASDDGWGFQATAYEETAREAIAAGLAAWPVQFSDVDAKGRDVLMLVFPLTQKDATDE